MRVGEVQFAPISETKTAKVILHKRCIDPTFRPAVAESMGPVVEGALMHHIDPSDWQTTLAGAAKRFINKTPDPKLDKFEALLDHVRELVKEFTPLSPQTDVSVEKWLSENTTYSQSRKAELLRKSQKEVDWETYFSNSFAKDEWYYISDTTALLKHLRCINARSDKFKTMTGPIFHQIEKILFKNPAFVKYVPVRNRPSHMNKVLGYLGCKYGETDFSACEAHFNEMKFEIEFIFYRHMIQYLPERDQFEKLLKVLSGPQKCRFKFMTIILLEAARMSGEMNTSLGNGFMNFALGTFFQKQLGCNGVFEGDDGALAGERLPTSEMYRDLGFKVEIAEHPNLSDISFCGLVFDPEDQVVVTDPIPEILGFGWTNMRYVGAKAKVKLALLRAKSISMLFQYSQCPILRSLALYGLRVTRSYSTDRIERFMSVYDRENYQKARAWFSTKRLAEIMSEVIPQRTRLLVSEKFSLPLEMQFELEKILDHKNDLEPIVYWPLVSMCTEAQRHAFATYVVDYEEFLPRYYQFPPVNFPSRDAFKIPIPKTITILNA